MPTPTAGIGRRGILAAPFIDQAAQRREQLWDAMDFVEDHQLILELPQETSRIGQLQAIIGDLQIEINGRNFRRHLTGQGRFSGLA